MSVCSKILNCVTCVTSNCSVFVTKTVGYCASHVPDGLKVVKVLEAGTSKRCPEDLVLVQWGDDEETSVTPVPIPYYFGNMTSSTSTSSPTSAVTFASDIDEEGTDLNPVVYGLGIVGGLIIVGGLYAGIQWIHERVGPRMQRFLEGISDGMNRFANMVRTEEHGDVENLVPERNVPVRPRLPTPPPLEYEEEHLYDYPCFNSTSDESTTNNYATAERDESLSSSSSSPASVSTVKTVGNGSQSCTSNARTSEYSSRTILHAKRSLLSSPKPSTSGISSFGNFQPPQTSTPISNPGRGFQNMSMSSSEFYDLPLTIHEAPRGFTMQSGRDGVMDLPNENGQLQPRANNDELRVTTNSSENARASLNIQRNIYENLTGVREIPIPPPVPLRSPCVRNPVGVDRSHMNNPARISNFLDSVDESHSFAPSVQEARSYGSFESAISNVQGGEEQNGGTDRIEERVPPPEINDVVAIQARPTRNRRQPDRYVPE